MRNGRAYHACVEVDGMMYALERHQDGSWSSAKKLDLITGEWSDVAKMPISVRDVQAVNYEGHLYIVGGCSGKKYQTVLAGKYSNWLEILWRKFHHPDTIGQGKCLYNLF